jgi:Domain of unknown function (DUF4440)
MKPYRIIAIAPAIMLAGICLLQSDTLRSAAALTITKNMQGTPTLEERVVALERKELDAIKAGNIHLISDLLADDAVFINSRGFGDKALVVKNTSEFKLIEHSMADVRFVPLTVNSGLIAYKLTEKGEAQGQEISGQVYAAAIWAERGGKWVCLFSQETPAK